MATFSDVYSRLLRILNRPSTETDVLAEVKACVNDAVRHIQRNHGFAHAEKVAQFTYPANALSVDLGNICAGPLRDVMSLQQLSSSATYEGKPVACTTYYRLQALRAKYEKRFAIDSTQIYNENTIGWTIEDHFRQDLIAWVMGNNIGLYPRPSTNTVFLLHHHIWLPELAADTDTNFLIDYCQDVVITIALKRIHFFMKVDNRFAVSDAEVEKTLETVRTWDSQVRENPSNFNRA